MNNLDKKGWEFSKEEKYSIDWLEAHGFEVTVKKRCLSKDVIEVMKNGLAFRFDLPLGRQKINYKSVMDQFDEDWKMFCRIQHKSID